MESRILGRLPLKRPKQNIQWEKAREISNFKMEDLLFGAVWESVAIVLLVFASLFMCSVFSGEVRIGVRDGSWILLIIFGTVFLRQVGVRAMLQRWQRMSAEPFAFSKKKGIFGGKSGDFLQEDRLDFLMLLSKLGLMLLLFLGFFMYARRHLEELKGGLLAIAQHYLDAYNRLFKANLIVAGCNEEWISGTLCFVILALFFEIYLLSGSQEQKDLFLIFPGISTALLMYVGLTPKWEHFFMAAVGFFMLSQGFCKKGARKGRLWSLVLFLGLFLGASFLFGGRAEGLMAYSRQAKIFEGKLEKRLETVFSGGLFFGRVKVNNDSPRFKDVGIITMRLDKQPTGNFYLQNFEGKGYENGRWIPADQDFSKICKENGVETQEAARFLRESIYRHYERVFTQGGNAKRTGLIKYKGMLGNDMLIPYSADTQRIKGLSYQEDGIAKKSLNKRKLEFEAWETDIVDLWLLRDVHDGVAADRGSKEQAFWSWYDKYAAEKFVEIPEDITESKSFQDALQEVKGVRNELVSGNLQRILVAGCVRDYLRNTDFAYSWDLDRLDPGMDPVRYFFEESRKGYCMHFASAGVFLLRGHGVPARYASGYVVKKSGFQQAADGSYQAEVVDRNAHAWVEVYLDGIGWVPLEVTPGYTDASGDLPTSKAAQAQRQKAAAQANTAGDAQNKGELSQKGEDAVQATVTPSAEETSAPEQKEIGESQSEGSKETDEGKKENSEERSGNKSGKDGKENGKKTGEGKDGILGDGKENDGMNGSGKSGKNGDGNEGKNNGMNGGKLLGILGKILAVFAILSGIAFAIWQFLRVRREKLAKMLRSKYYRGAVKLLNQRLYRNLKFRRKVQKKHARGGAATDLDLEEALLRILGEEKKALVGNYMQIVKAAMFSRANLSAKDYKLVKRVYGKVIKR